MAEYVDYFPTYLQWIASHSDATLREFFTQLLSSLPAEDIHDATELPTHSEHTLNSLLAELSSTQLALLHAAAEMDAGKQPTSVEELTDTLAELFEITGTPPQEIPTPEQLAQDSAVLVRRGLLYSPDLDLTMSQADLAQAWHPERLYAVPPQIPTAFDPATEHVWRLVDAHRNPLSEQELQQLFEQQTDRQRSILRMLVTNGGVGHSAAFQPGANPDHPLALMLTAGLLDRLDDTTVRVTGRLQEMLYSTTVAPAGGAWAGPEHGPLRADSSITDAAVAHIVQLLTQWSDAIEDLAQAPITPLNKGGIGVREIKKIAHRRDMTEQDVHELLTQLLELNLLALGETTPRYEGSLEHFFAITEHALDFLEHGLASQWADVLVAWSASTYAPWYVDGDEVRTGQKDATSYEAARLRSIFPHLVTSAGTTRHEVEQHLWRLRPQLAWETTQEAWDAVWKEAHDLGLIRIHDGDVNPTPAALALARSGSATELASALQELLPQPVDMLIVQGDHTILAPGPLAPEDAHILSRFAVKESSGMASVWRVTADTLRHGIAQGYTATRFLDFLGTMSPARSTDGLPQSLRYMVHDVARNAEAGASDNNRSVAYRIIAEPAEQPARIEHMLEYIGSYRDWLDEQGDDIDGLGSGGMAVDPAEITDMLRTAAEDGRPLEVSYANAEGASVAVAGTVIAVSPTMFSIITADGGSTSVQPHRLISARLLSPEHG